MSRAEELLQGYSFSYWDAMIVAASLQAWLERLYTEDFGGYSKIEQLEIVNPFQAP